ncbi:MAG: hypothetical protein FJW32_13970 [Acidobacteria bacterium]|nr:hypothetical protein [Acidobacteriota bacterium]
MLTILRLPGAGRIERLPMESIRLRLLTVMAAASFVNAQTPAPTTPAPAKPAAEAPKQAPTTLKKVNYVRPISAGGTFGFLALVPVGEGSFVSATNVLSRNDETKSKGSPIGFGGLVQVALPKKFAVAATYMIHASKLETTKNTIEGIDNPFTTADERKISDVKENSSIKYRDFGILIRRYDKDHTKQGVRVFVEGGPSFRAVQSIRTTRTTTILGVSTNDNKPIDKKVQNLTRGWTGGIGVQYNDDFGFRVVPEFRYTRWMDKTFDKDSYNSRKNQFEVILSITF